MTAAISMLGLKDPQPTDPTCHVERLTRLAGPGWSILVDVGLNPHRRQRRSPADIAVVMGALAVIVAVTLWAILG